MYSALTLTCAIDTQKMGRVKRKTAFTNIISNYFTTDPFFKAKQKPRIHLPPKPLPRVELSNLPPKNMQQPLNAVHQSFSTTSSNQTGTSYQNFPDGEQKLDET